jgi:hypothetical protein
MSIIPSSTKVSTKCGTGALTFRKWIFQSFPIFPKARIASTTSFPIAAPPSSQVPQQRHTPMFGLFAISRARA